MHDVEEIRSWSVSNKKVSKGRKKGKKKIETIDVHEFSNSSDSEEDTGRWGSNRRPPPKKTAFLGIDELEDDLNNMQVQSDQRGSEEELPKRTPNVQKNIEKAIKKHGKGDRRTYNSASCSDSDFEDSKVRGESMSESTNRLLDSLIRKQEREDNGSSGDDQVEEKNSVGVADLVNDDFAVNAGGKNDSDGASVSRH